MDFYGEDFYGFFYGEVNFLPGGFLRVGVFLKVKYFVVAEKSR